MKSLAFSLTAFISTLVTFFSPVQAQVFNISSNGWDTTASCTGILRDPGGTGFYPNSANGYMVIDPPGNNPVSVQFAQFTTQASSDYVYIYDGIGNSGALLGSYSGTSLPNNGNPISSTSGAITIRFYSNFSQNYAGFEMSWVSGSTNAPTASFAFSTNSPAFNRPVQFINTTLNGGTYEWHFGDGTTSTETNPSHSYTSTGLKQVYLVASNCAGSDTSSIANINVQAPPQGSVNPDTVVITTACGTSNSGSFTISNGGSGTLFYDLELTQTSQNLILNETFENNSIGAFSVSNSSLSYSIVNSTSAPQGQRYLQMTGTGSFNNGMDASFPNATPESVSYWVMSPNSNSYHGYSNIGQTDQFGNFTQIFYSVFRYGDLRLYYRDPSGGFTTSYYHPRNLNQWYHIELRNIDFVNQTYDIYIDNTLLIASAGFNNSVNSLNKINFYNSSFSDFAVDNVQISGNDLLNKVSFNPTTGTLGNGSSNVIFINANASDLVAGTYWLDFIISSNDTALDGKTVPVKLIVTGSADLNQDRSCITYGNIFPGYAVTDSVLVWNSGCDTLNITGTTSTSTDISSSLAPVDLGPGDSLYVHVTLAASALGSYNDTLYLNGPDTTAHICITGQANPIPAITTDSATYHIYHQGCGDSVQFSAWLINNGQGQLNWSARSNVNSNLSDNFESSVPDPNLWSGYSFNVSNGSFCGIISGNKSLIFEGSGQRYIETVPLNIAGGGTIDFTMNQSNCELADNGEGIYIDYSTNNGLTWTNISYHYISSLNTDLVVSEPIPTAAQGSQVKFRLIQNQNSGSGYENWIVDDFSINYALSNVIDFTPDTSSIAANDSILLTGKIGLDGFNTGTYNFTANLQSNDPANPVYSFPVVLHLTGIPNIVSNVSCLDMDTIMANTTVSDSILVYNDGCGDLNITAYNNSTSEFNILSSPITLAPDDSTYIQVQFAPTTNLGLIHDTISILSNDTTLSICLKGFALPAPAISMDTSAINVSLSSCNDSLLVQRTIYNNGLGNLDYRIGGSEGLSLQEILDTFRNQYSAITSLIPSVYDFSTGSSGYYISDGGYDMYDNGNRLTATTTTTSPYIYYSDNMVTATTDLGPQGQYFTYEGIGIWLFAADIDGVSQFDISGGLGADGFGVADGTVLTSSIGGQSFTGFVKRVYNVSEPSVNHLVIVPEPNTAQHNFTSNTDSDQHTITGLNGTNRIYYLLYASRTGLATNYIDNPTTQAIMDKFLEVIYAGRLSNWITVTPDSGQVNPSDSSVVDIWIKSVGLSAGTHTTSITVNTNDPLNPNLTIPIQLTVSGAAETQVPTTCLDYDSLLIGLNSLDSTLISNVGCDSLFVTGFNSPSGQFSVQNLPLHIAPGEEAMAQISFTPSVASFTQDTIYLYTNADTAAICVSGKGLAASQVLLFNDTLRVTVNKCLGVQSEVFSFGNSGQGTLYYDLKSQELYQDTSRIVYTTSGATTLHSFTNLPSSADTIFFTTVVNGDYDSSGETYSVEVEGTQVIANAAQSLTAGTNDTAIFYYTGPLISTWLSDGQLDVSMINSPAVDIFSLPSLNMHFVQVKMGTNTPWISIQNPSSGSLNGGGVTFVNIDFDPTNLSMGVHTSTLVMESNDPGNPNYRIPVVLTVVEKPEIKVSVDCIDFGVVNTASVTDTIYIKNIGCSDLLISGITFLDPQFSTTIAVNVIPAGDSLALPVTFTPNAGTSGTLNSSFTILNNDSQQNVCLKAITDRAPLANATHVINDPCNGTVIFTDLSQNAPTQWEWDFGDGATGFVQNPVHTYLKPGNYQVRLITRNNAGRDTAFIPVDMTSLLYADFSMPDSVYATQQFQFFDSSEVATSWEWYFGDGDTSNLQNPTHTYSKPGTYFVTLIVSNGTCTITLNRQVKVYSGIGLEEGEIVDMRVYRVPADQRLEREWSSHNIMISLQVHDASGKLLLQKDISSNESETINVSSYPTGMYILRMTDEFGNISHRKFTIRH
ncbi:MAG TPA: hypothetical protein DCG19_05460 [Cryomorphaceae bacterium]|nr:hypothetical protein [Cryomorphaceae bacterium]